MNISFNNAQINAGNCGAYSVQAFLNEPVAPCIHCVHLTPGCPVGIPSEKPGAIIIKPIQGFL
jgi:hypothetical protein